MSVTPTDPLPDALFSGDDLENLLQEPVATGSAVTAERLVWGWLSPILDTLSRPVDVSPQLWSWAVELGAIAYSNPGGLSEYQLGGERQKFSAERRDQILADVASGGTASANGGVPAPQGDFPPVRCYPGDPLDWW